MTPSPDSQPGTVPGLPALNFVGAAPGERFDRLTRLAQQMFDTPLALLSLVDSDRRWVQSRVERDSRDSVPELAFCRQMVAGDDLLIVPDARADERFRDHPCVVDLPEIRFFAGCPVRAPDGRALGTLCVVDHEPREVSEKDASVLLDLAWMLEQDLKTLSLATMDDLTGITNRRGFEAIAAHTIAVCRRGDQPATLLYFDLDDFKEINDNLGHAAGDRALRRFADRLCATFRDSDVVARVGGDEFCVLLTSATTADVERPLSILAERLRSDQGAPPVSFSVGVVPYDPARHRSVQDLVDDSDRQMYRDKSRRGRDTTRA